MKGRRFPTGEAIRIKSPEEIEGIRRAGRVLAKVLKAVASVVLPGVSTAELDEYAERLIREAGARPAFKGYKGYRWATCICINEEVLHGIPRKSRRIREGDIVSIDIGVELEGFYADASKTVMVGKVPRRVRRLVRVAEEALYKAIEQAVPGNRVGAISHAIERHVLTSGFDVVREFVGHGVGLELHEEPQIPNYGEPDEGPLLEPGMTLAIEVMAVMGRPEVLVLSDGWTVVTADGKPAAHFEHTVAVTEKGPEILTGGEDK